MDENLFYVCRRDEGVKKYDAENDSMLSIQTSPDKSEWEKYSWEEANAIKRTMTQHWKVLQADEDEEDILN